MKPSLATFADVGELGFLKRLTRLLGPPPSGVVGVGDDAAVFPRPAGSLLLTTDSMVEDVHFRRRWFRPEEVGHKALAANLSDVAAMGGQAEAALVSLILPPETRLRSVERLYRGLLAYAARERVQILGGNLARGPVFSITLALFGALTRDEPLLRSGARPGDRVYMTGQPGLARLGHRLLASAGARRPDLWTAADAKHPAWRRDLGRSVPGGTSALKRFLTPTARLATARDLLVYRPTAAIDVSDGPASDLHHLTGRGKGLSIRADLLPRSAAFRRLAAALEEDPVSAVLEGGEDYELVFTLPRETAESLGPRAVLNGVRVTRVGEVVEEEGVSLVDGSKTRKLPKGGYEHFKKSKP